MKIREAELFYQTQHFADGDGDGAEGAGGQEGQEGGQEGEGDKGGQDVKKYSDRDLDQILNKRFARWQKQQQAAISEAEKLAHMSEAEKSAKAMKDLQAEIAELKRDKALADVAKTARGILAEEGITVSEAILSALVTDDAEATDARVKEYAKAFKQAVQAEVKRQLKGAAPKTATPGGASGMIKAQIMAIKDQAARQKAIAENLSLFRV